MGPELLVGITATAALLLFGCWRLFRWFFGGTPGPNPWDEATEERIQQPDAVPLCRRCLEPYEDAARYCSHCGLPVDSLVPLSPFHQLFAVGDVLLTGTQRRFSVNWITITGFVLLSMIQYMVFAPVYWFCLLRNVRRLRAEAAEGRKPHATDADSSRSS
jgi:hypothetical protein